MSDFTLHSKEPREFNVAGGLLPNQALYRAAIHPFPIEQRVYVKLYVAILGKL
jgi:hypothetical protein